MIFHYAAPAFVQKFSLLLKVIFLYIACTTFRWKIPFIVTATGMGILILLLMLCLLKKRVKKLCCCNGCNYGGRLKRHKFKDSDETLFEEVMTKSCCINIRTEDKPLENLGAVI